MEIEFAKMQGLGNDFVVVDGTQHPFRPTAALLAHLADRRFGVGCDQILVVDPAPSGDVDFGYRIYNADSSEVGQCGNGARCLARFVRARGLFGGDRLRVRTASRTLELLALPDGRIRVDMGAPLWQPSAIPFLRPEARLRYGLDLDGDRIEFGAVSIGNPHAVIEVDDVDAAPVPALGPRLQRDASFPEGVNVGFVEIIDATSARLRVYERGAGETMACGSGACAAMVVARRWGKLGKTVTMRLRGGDLLIEWEGDGHPVWMTGPAEWVYEGRLQWPS